MAAVMAICSIITIPLPFTPVPINLGLLGVFLAGGLLGPAQGTISIVIYIALGAAGLPVFSGMRGGLGILIGPTGGYIAGFVAAAFVCGFLCKKKTDYPHLFFSFFTATVVCYLLGTLWFVISGGSQSFYGALSLCVFPFIPGDLLKICLSCFLVKRLRNIIRSLDL